MRVADPLLRIIHIELKNRLPELILMRVDKMSMANSIETRVPFLDEDVVAFALSIPSALKFKQGQPKYILKQAARGIIPDSIIDRKKWGFCCRDHMLSTRLVEYARSRILESPFIAERFNRHAIEEIFVSLREQKRFNSFKIWNLLNFSHCGTSAGCALTRHSARALRILHLPFFGSLRIPHSGTPRLFR